MMTARTSLVLKKVKAWREKYPDGDAESLASFMKVRIETAKKYLKTVSKINAVM